LLINLFSPRYGWKIAELALNNNHSSTHQIQHNKGNKQHPLKLNTEANEFFKATE
jgi:hypothetical protein